MEYHGFVRILAAPNLADDRNYLLGLELAEAMREEAAQFVDAAFVELNGEWFFRAHGNHNHASAFAPVRAFLERLVASAPGSFGLFYVLDEEDPVPGLRDFYRVLVVRRGVISESFDPFLSPTSGVVLDPYDPDGA